MRLAAAAILLLAPLAQAWPESAAPDLHPQAEAAWHEPEEVRPGEQWAGYLRLRHGHTIANASYQVCNLANGVCFAPPTPARFAGQDLLRFHTSEYLAGGKPVSWEAGWRIGVKWILTHGNGTVDCLPGPCGSPPGGEGGLEAHYLAFDMPARKEAPAASLPILLAFLLAAAGRRR
jgi:hypothetical protein